MAVSVASPADPATLVARGAGVLWAIGNTPLIDVSMLLDAGDTPDGVRLLAKLESSNPSGSAADRVALQMLRRAMEHGQLAPGQRIIEATSGNVGISLAMLGRLLGHPVTIVVPQNVTPEHLAVMQAYGAEVVSSPAGAGIAGAVQLSHQLAASDPSAFLPRQYENDANPRAHYEGTGRELLAQVEGPIGAFVAALGSGGTLMGVGRRLREQHRNVSVVAAEPLEFDQGYVPPVLDATLLDRRILVSNGNAALGMRDLSRAGVFAGVSSGAALHAARRIAPQMEPGHAIVLLVADGAWRYLSAGLWGGEQDAAALDEAMAGNCWW